MMTYLLVVMKTGKYKKISSVTVIPQAKACHYEASQQGMLIQWVRLARKKLFTKANMVAMSFAVTDFTQDLCGTEDSDTFSGKVHDGIISFETFECGTSAGSISSLS